LLKPLASSRWCSRDPRARGPFRVDPDSSRRLMFQLMFKLFIVSVLIVSFVVIGSAQQQPAKPESKPQVSSPADSGPFIAPAELNVHLDSDARMFVTMAALNMAGFDYEPAGQALSPARVELRKDLAKLDPQVKAKLAEFYKSHRRQGVDEAVDAARYATLSLLMTPPPAFTIQQSPDHGVPDDLKPLLDFVPLLREFYVKSGIRELIPKYTAVSEAYAAAYYRPVGELIYQLLEYFHVRPETIINMKPLVVSGTGEARESGRKTTVVARNRTRQVFIVPDPLGAMNSAIVRGDILNQKDDLLLRRVGDDYIVVVGPSRTVQLDSIRQALIRFLIDPLVERNLKPTLEYKDDFVKLVSAVPTAGKEYSASVYLVVRESLAQAAEARLRRIDAARKPAYTDDDATYDLAQAYLRGAALSFHFYDALTGFEKVGISLTDFFEQMIATINFEREQRRAKDFEEVVARVAAKRANSPKPGGEPEPTLTPVAKKILMSDDLIRQRKFSDAKPILQEVLEAEPANARALYGMAQVVTQSPAPVELDPKADENDKIQAQHDRLEQAIKLYQKAIANASREGEAWLIQWSHVYLGRIYDFQEFRQDAIAEYEKAIAMGNVPNGGYKEALEGKERPFGQKQ